jgi:hypothetical protein
MPWTAEEAKAWVEGATDKQAEVGAQVANEALARCTEEKGDDCEGSAIRQAKAVMGKLKESGPFGERLASALIETATKEAVGVSGPARFSEVKLADGESMQSYMDKISSAVSALGNPDKNAQVWVYLSEVFDKEAVYERSGNGMERTYWRVAYRFTPDGVVLGKPEQVERVTSYRPVGTGNLAAEAVNALLGGPKTVFVETSGAAVPVESE